MIEKIIQLLKESLPFRALTWNGDTSLGFSFVPLFFGTGKLLAHAKRGAGQSTAGPRSGMHILEDM